MKYVNIRASFCFGCQIMLLQSHPSTIPESSIEDRVAYALEHHFQTIVGETDRYQNLRTVLSALPLEQPLSINELSERLNLSHELLRKRLLRLIELTNSWPNAFGFKVVRTLQTRSRGFDSHLYCLERVDPWVPPQQRQILTPAPKREDEVELILDERRGKHLSGLLSAFDQPALGFVPSVSKRERELLLAHSSRTFDIYDRPELEIVRRLFDARSRNSAVSVSSLLRDFDIPSTRRQLPNRIEKKSIVNALALGYVIECRSGFISVDFLDPRQRRDFLAESFEDDGNPLYTTFTKPVIPNFPDFAIRTFNRRLNAVRDGLDPKLCALFEQAAGAQVSERFVTGATILQNTGIPMHAGRYWVPRSQKDAEKIGMFLRYRGDQSLECLLLAKN